MAAWLRQACELAPAEWGRHLPFPVELALTGLETANPEDSLGRRPDAAVGYRVSVRDALPTLLVFPRTLALALIAGMLGDASAELPAFFLQAEDGIRVRTVTGVQTCALPIWRGRTGGHCPPSSDFSRIRFLMCPPAHFDVQYVINPWMEGNVHRSSHAAAAEQWQKLHRLRSEERRVGKEVRTRLAAKE